MARITRLIIYDSDDEEALTKQLSKSLPEGIHDYGEIKVTVIDGLRKDFDDYLDSNE